MGGWKCAPSAIGVVALAEDFRRRGGLAPVSISCWCSSFSSSRCTFACRPTKKLLGSISSPIPQPATRCPYSLKKQIPAQCSAVLQPSPNFTRQSADCRDVPHVLNTRSRVDLPTKLHSLHLQRLIALPHTQVPKFLLCAC